MYFQAGETALWLACQGGYYALVQCLLESGAPPLLTDKVVNVFVALMLY